MNVLGIETTCDETACAVVRDGKEILSNVVSSQILLHRPYGGVIPELACRTHIKLLMPIIEKSLKEANCSFETIDLISVAKGPGLIGALLIGINTAKTLSLALKKPFIGVNHIKAHLYAAMMSQKEPVVFPCLGVILSGGHTALVYMKDLFSYELISQTVDDAIGEAFDKAAKMLGLPYPGGPEIEKLAKEGNPLKYPFKAGHVKESPLYFSFSGLKTAVLYKLKGQNEKLDSSTVTWNEKADVAASFQYAAFKDVIEKVHIACEKFSVKTVLFGGGVTQNRYLRKLFAENFSHSILAWPSPELSLDNGAMIAGMGYHEFIAKGYVGDSISLLPEPRIPF